MVRAIEFRPGARSIVHHALFYLDTTGTARELETEDDEAGFVRGEIAVFVAHLAGDSVDIIAAIAVFREPQLLTAQFQIT